MIRSKIVGHVDKQLLLSGRNNYTAIKAIHRTGEVIKKTARSRQGCELRSGLHLLFLKGCHYCKCCYYLSVQTKIEFVLCADSLNFWMIH